MPFGVTFTYRPLAPRRANGRRSVPLAQRLQALADTAVTRFRQLWQGLLTDVRTEVQGLVSTPLTEQVVGTVITTTLTQPAQRLLPLVVEDVVERAGAQTLASVGLSLTFQPGTPTVQAAIDAYVGLQIQDISETTREAVRAVLLTAWTEGQPLAAVAREVQTIIGLTPRQAQTVARLQARLVTEGRTPAQIQRALEMASRVAIRQRALQIARTESQSASNMGSHLALVRSVEEGLVEAQNVRRVWTTALDEALCSQCAPIPDMNPQGVGLHEPFQTPVGEVLFPPLHPNCRCSVDVVIT